MLAQRLAYADAHFAQYTEWCAQVGDSPYSPRDKLEWAIITAHCPFDKSVAGFLATRNILGLQPLAVALAQSGVMAAGNKAAYITQLRNGDWQTPRPDYRAHRRSNKLPGLGHCKLSFAACLIDPFGADVVCLDTHMLACYGGQVAKCYRSLAAYEAVEDEVLAEANVVGMPPFAYQWAIWDWWRCKTKQVSPQNHSFLWRAGPTAGQLPLFSSLS